MKNTKAIATGAEELLQQLEYEFANTMQSDVGIQNGERQIKFLLGGLILGRESCQLLPLPIWHCRQTV